MRAARVHAPGKGAAVTIDDVAEPTGPGVRISIAAAGVNPLDWKLRAGWFSPAPAPFILGQDVAGMVAEDADGFAAGEAVYAMLPMDALGGYAELVIAPASAIARSPRSLNPAAAAAVPMGALTALAALDDVAKLQAGERVLIHGGGGAVGSFAAQIAKARGCWVAATASGDDLAWLQGRGVDLAVDHRTERFENALAGRAVDFVLDVLGGETQARSWAVLTDGGRMVSTLGATEPPDDAAARGVRRSDGFGATPDGARLAVIAGMIDEDVIEVRPPIEMPMVRAAEALDRLEQGRAHGKIVLTPREA